MRRRHAVTGIFLAAVSLTGCSVGGGSSAASETCQSFMAASSAAQYSTVQSLQSNLIMTFGSATVSKYVQILNFDCPQNSGDTLSSLLTQLGYYG